MPDGARTDCLRLCVLENSRLVNAPKMMITFTFNDFDTTLELTSHYLSLNLLINFNVYSKCYDYSKLSLSGLEVLRNFQFVAWDNFCLSPSKIWHQIKLTLISIMNLFENYNQHKLSALSTTQFKMQIHIACNWRNWKVKKMHETRMNCQNNLNVYTSCDRCASMKNEN